jgi:hypothetical protein
VASSCEHGNEFHTIGKYFGLQNYHQPFKELVSYCHPLGDNFVLSSYIKNWGNEE